MTMIIVILYVRVNPERDTFSHSGEVYTSNTAQYAALKYRLNRSAIIYGANASGKSNLILALGFVQLLLLNAVRSTPTGGMRTLDHPLLRPFLLDPQTRQAPTEFELTFLHNDVRYQYGLLLDRQRIYEEWLIAFPKGQPQTWFERRWSVVPPTLPNIREQHELFDTTEVIDSARGDYTWYFGPRLVGEKQRLADLTRPDVPFLAAAAIFGNTQLRDTFAWFTNQFAVLNPWGHPDLLGQTARQTLHDPSLRDRLRELLLHADIGIADYSVRVIPVGDDPVFSAVPEQLLSAMTTLEFQRIEMTMRHQATGLPEGMLDLTSDDESLGTRRFFAIAGPIITALDRGQTLAVDEIDDSLHPLLVRRLIELFHSPATNPHGAQLIVNTHDATMLDTRLFRRDQIWFTEKDDAGASRLYPLSDYSPRKEESLSKGYLHGRYGAVPMLTEFGASLKEPYAETQRPRRRKKGEDDDGEAAR